LTAVHGQVLTRGHQPVPFAVVMANGVTTVTNAQGAFTIESVPGRYDLTVIVDAYKVIEIVDGLTTRSPTIELIDVFVDHQTGVVAGKLSGGAGFPIPKGHAGLVRLTTEQTNFRSLELIPGDFAYTLDTVTWEQGDTVAADLFALQWVVGASGPTSYTGFAHASVTLQQGKVVGNENGSVAATNLALTAPPERIVSGTLKVSGKPASIFASLELGRTVNTQLTLKPGAFSVTVPDVGLPPVLLVQSRFGPDEIAISLVPVPAENSGWDIEVGLPPALVLPLNNAKNVNFASPFSWAPPAEPGFALFTWGIGEWAIYRLTDKTEVTLPDLRDAGVDYGDVGQDAGWWVTTYGGVDHVEEALPLTERASPAWYLHAPLTTAGSALRHFQLAE
jgi:hypothetical protein